MDIDLEKFFDRVNHDILMGLVAKRVADKRLLKLIRGFLTAGVLEGGLVSATEEGTPQGGPLSPLLSNLMLDVLDKELEKRGHRFVRYADDCNIYVRSRKAGERVMAGIEKFLEKRLKLKVNKAKSAVAKPSVRKFLGFSFTGGKEPRRRIAPQAITRFKARVRELTRRTCGRSLEQIAKELSTYLVGWRGYFGFCQTPSVLSALDQWIRRRLRAIAWKQWKRGRTRFAELRRRGVGRDLAAQTAGSPHGPWRRALRLTLPCKLSSSGHSAWLPSRLRDPHNPPNRRIRTRTYGGVGGATPRGVPLSRFWGMVAPTTSGQDQVLRTVRLFRRLNAAPAKRSSNCDDCS
ncbi:RNA-directed DNA polymerase [Bradyrhizobium sp. LB9.1b]